jgi:hypothetical protein
VDSWSGIASGLAAKLSLLVLIVLLAVLPNLLGSAKGVISLTGADSALGRLVRRQRCRIHVRSLYRTYITIIRSMIYTATD